MPASSASSSSRRRDSDAFDGVEVAVQEEPLGTGDAVALPRAPRSRAGGDVLVLNGDVPALTAETLRALVETHRARRRRRHRARLRARRRRAPTAASCATRRPARADRRGGRRDRRGARARRGQLRHLRLPGRRSGPLLERLEPHNAQGELYVTDTLGLLVGDGEAVAVHTRGRSASRWRGSTRASSSRSPPRRSATGSTRRTCSPASRSSTRPRPGSRPASRSSPTSRSIRSRVLRGDVRIASGAEIGPFAYVRPGTVLGEGAKIGTFVEVKNVHGRRPDEDAAPLLHRRRRDRRGHEHRAPATSPPTSSTSRASPRSGRRIGSNVRTGVDNIVRCPCRHWRRRLDCSRARSSRMMSLPDRSPGSPRARRPRKGGSTTSMESLTALSSRCPGWRRPSMTEPAPGHWIERGPQKRLMVFSGRSHPDLARAIAEQLGVKLGDVELEHVQERRDVLPLRGVDPRRRRLHRADGLPAGRPEPDGAHVHDPGGEARVGEADHRGHPALPVRAPGPQGEAARADLRAPRRRHAPARRRRPRADDGPARRPDPGLLHDPGRPHDGAAAVRAPLPRSRPHRRRTSSRSRPTKAARRWPSASRR